MKTKLSFKQTIIAWAMAAGAAAVVNAVIFSIFHAAGVITDDIMVQPNEPLTVGPVIVSSILPIFFATLVFYLLERFTNKGFLIFSIIAVVLLLISLSSPFMAIPNVPTPYAIVLDLMHVVVVGSLLFFLNRSIKNNTK